MEKKSGHFEDEAWLNVFMNIGPVLFFIGISIIVPIILKFPSGFAVGSILLCMMGFILFSLAKFSMFKQGRWLTFGSSEMTPRNRFFYRLGYVLMVFAATSVLILLVCKFWFSGWLQVDRCLDSGGRWNYERKTCEH